MPVISQELLDKIKLQIENDWTIDPETHRSNSNELFIALSRRVEHIIRNSAFDIVDGRADRVGGLIMAQLTHRYGLSPRDVPRCPKCTSMLDDDKCEHCGYPRDNAEVSE